jgi:hypothetical protein
LQTGDCKECLVDHHCPGASLCAPDHKCHFACSVNADCTDPNKPLCDAVANDCVECLSAADCPASAPFCKDDKRCVGCLIDIDCADLTDTPFCEKDACVQCMVDADCLDPMFPKCKGHSCEP